MGQLNTRQASNPTTSVKSSSAAKPRWSRRRVVTLTLLGLPLSAIVLWVLVHRVPWLGPLLANSLRAVFGADNVAKLEEFAYGVEDRFNRIFRGDEAPKAYWSVPKTAKNRESPPKATALVAEAPELAPFAPRAPGPVHASWSAPGDGEWVPILDPLHPKDAPRMLKTLLHPDRHRSWAELFVVAIDLRRVELHLMAGSREPEATTPAGKAYKRPAKIPERDHAKLLAAFNGGFMAEHGHYGMMLDGVTLLPPKPSACTIALYQDQSLKVAPWEALSKDEPEFVWYRQAPNCMVTDGKLHPLLAMPKVRRWGATLDGNTVIRRSAIGLNAARDVLYVGISNHTNAGAIAQGMAHAGAVNVAQMDVNWSYPKFVLFDEARKAVALAEGFEFSEDEYIRKRSLRDFFYVTRKDPDTTLEQPERSANSQEPAEKAPSVPASP